MRTWPSPARLLGGAALALLALSPGIARAQAWLLAGGGELQERHQVEGTVETSAYGYGSLLGTSSAGVSWLEEGATGRYRGFLWQPRLAQADLSLEAFAVQQVSRQGIAPGRRLGYAASLKLLPASIVPLTLRASSRETSLTTRTLPGLRYRSSNVGLSWRLVAPWLFPRLWLRLDDQRFSLHTDSFLLPDRTGLSRGQDLGGRRRIARLDLAHDDEHAHLRAFYEVEDRVDDGVDTLTGEVSSRRMVIESANVSGQATPSRQLSLSLFGDLRTTRAPSFESRRYLASAYLHLEPDERLRAVGSYTFQGDTLFGTRGQVLQADGYFQWTETLEARLALAASESRYAQGSPVEGVSRQALTMGGTYRDTFDDLDLYVQELVTTGFSQADPGEAGIVFENALTGQASYPVARGHLLSAEGGILNAIDRSSFGVDVSTYLLATHWVGSLGAGTSAYSDLTLLHERRNDRFRGFDPEQRTQAILRFTASRRLSRELDVSGVGGWSYARSSLDPLPSNTPYAALSLAWRPRPRLSLRSQLQWQSYLYAGHSRSTVEAQGDLLWRIRAIELSASYRIRFSDAVGIRDLSHVFILSLRRRLGRAF